VDLEEIYRGEYETWELLRCLNLADRVYHKNQALRFDINQCPKTAAQTKILQNHKHLVILAVARWLERTYSIPESRKDLKNEHLINIKVSFLDEFDNKKFLENDKVRDEEK
jgi:hypothetical protein